MKKQRLIVALVLAVLTAGAALGVRFAPDLFPVSVGSKAPQFHAVDLVSVADKWQPAG